MPRFLGAISLTPAGNQLKVIWVSSDLTQLAYKQYIIEHGIEFYLCTWGREDPYDFWGIQGLPNIILVRIVPPG